MFLPGSEPLFSIALLQQDTLSILLTLKDGWLNISVTYVLLGNFRLPHRIWYPKEDLDFHDPLDVRQAESLNL